LARPLVLVADDSPVVLHVLQTTLRGGGCEVVTAKDGIEAIEKAFAQDVDLIILDVMMPRLNGYQACRLLKNEAETRAIPVIILTSKDQPGDRFWGLQTGADHFVTKDAAPERILGLVREVLPEHAQRGPRPAGAKRTSVDVLTRVNELLDRRLFEATILSEIGRVARSLVQLDETVCSVMGLVGRVVDFTVGGMAFLDGDDLEAVLALNHPASPKAIDEVRAHLVETCHRQRHGAPLASVRSRLLTLVGTDGRAEETTIKDFVSYPVEASGRLVGLLVLAGRGVTRLTAETEALMALVTNQAHIVVENARLVERLRNLSIRDGLTELFNHRHSMELLAGEFQRIGRYEEAVSLLMVDIDHFKAVNDTHGHQVGDVILREVAHLLVRTLRSVDSVGRYGGEEFVVILPHTRPDEARGTAERLRRLVEQETFQAGDKTLKVTVSIGVASFPAPGLVAPSDLIRASDEALYRAKQGGRNRVE
jgi:two-component system cell cycle response regulator